MEVIFLGTGTSQGVPMIAQDPEAAIDMKNPKNWRTRTSIHVVMGGQHIQVDAAPEFRLQCVQNDIRWIDTFILTHGHADHVLGMDDLRRFIDLRDWKAMPVYASEEGLDRVSTIYPYAMREVPEFKGYPAFQGNLMPECLELEGGKVYSCFLPHGRINVLGLVFEEKDTGKRLAYYTDCKEVTPRGYELATDADVVILDALRPDPHPSHMHIDAAMAAASKIGAKETYFTHMTYMVDHDAYSQRLPEGIAFAYDGLRVKI